MLAENAPTVCVELTATKRTVFIHCPPLISRSYNSYDKSTSHPDAIVGKKNEIETLGFKDRNLYGLSAYDFSPQKLRDWVTYVSPNTWVGLVDCTTQLTMLAPHERHINKISEQT